MYGYPRDLHLLTHSFPPRRSSDLAGDELTPRQAEILAFILRHRDEHGAPPTRAEIVTAFGFRSPTAAEDHLRALARKGAIDLRAGASRGIRVLADVLPAEAANEIGRAHV